MNQEYRGIILLSEYGIDEQELIYEEINHKSQCQSCNFVGWCTCKSEDNFHSIRSCAKCYESGKEHNYEAV